MADERKRLVLGLRSKPPRDRYHRVIRRKTRSSLDARLHADLPHKQLGRVERGVGVAQRFSSNPSSQMGRDMRV